MTPTQMRRALELESQATILKRQFDDYVLLNRDAHSRPESINVGEPQNYRGEKTYSRLEAPIPQEARRHVFALWRKQVALDYNAKVRELAQLGATTDHRLIEFSEATGMPK